jgi:hypothetical protein
VEEPQKRWEKILEIVGEVSVLAIVAIATAYSGYQGTQWGGQARLYGLASTTRFEAEAVRRWRATARHRLGVLHGVAAGPRRRGCKARVHDRGALLTRV